LLLLETFNRCI